MATVTVRLTHRNGRKVPLLAVTGRDVSLISVLTGENSKGGVATLKILFRNGHIQFVTFHDEDDCYEFARLISEGMSEDDE